MFFKWASLLVGHCQEVFLSPQGPLGTPLSVRVCAENLEQLYSSSQGVLCVVGVVVVVDVVGVVDTD